jgi:ABC-type sulfate transport system permease component
MYEFATIALLGLALYKVMDLVGALGHLSRAATITLTILLGVGLTWLIDYNVFAGWSQVFRKDWMGVVSTGIVIAGMATVWEAVFGFLASYGHRRSPETTDTQIRSAA